MVVCALQIYKEAHQTASIVCLRLSYMKLHVQIENNPRLPQSQTEAQLLSPSLPTFFFRYYPPLQVDSIEK